MVTPTYWKGEQELQELYCEVGPPKVLQCDNGGEFKQAVEQLCRKLEVKIIRSSPYHPQSQGKVERSHRTLRKKIMYDLGHVKSWSELGFSAKRVPENSQ